MSTNKMSNKHKICLVCGDKAIGKNFGAVSCESCKAFFRRNASKSDDYVCHYIESCKIDSHSRKFCRSCRLRKCFDVGMQEDWILNDEEREERRQKIETNRQQKGKEITMKRKTKTKTKSVSNKLDNENSCPENGSESVIIDNHSIADTLSEEQNSRSQDMDNDFYVPNIDSSDIDSTDSYYESQSAVVAIAKPINDYNNNNFNENEMHFVSELLSAIKHMKRNLVAISVWEPTNIDDFFRPLMNKHEESISSFVKTCKSLKAFKDICERDQMTLFKSGGIEALTFYRYTRFDYDNDWWKVVMDNGNAVIIRLDLFKQHRFETVYPMSKKTLNNIKHTLDLDLNIIYLLLPIIIFNPNKSNLVHPEIVRFQQQLYMFLLQRYLRIRYGSECDTKLAQILDIIQDIRQLTDIHNQDTRLKDPKLLGPLLREVLDIELPPVDQYSLTAL